MDLGIRGRRAVVTASSGGMGRNIAHALAKEGVNLVLFARSDGALRDVAKEIEQAHDVDVVCQSGDMTDEAGVSSLVTTLEHLGGLDIVVLVTARPPTPLRPTLQETESRRWQEAFENQLGSVVHLVNGIAPLMLDRGWGRVVAVTSAHSKQPTEGHALSTVFRAGVTAYMKGLATALGPHGITVNCVAPALIETSHRVGTAAYTDEQTAQRSSLSPLGRQGTQEEVSAVVSFLASQQAGFVTGATVVVDGGMSSSLF